MKRGIIREKKKHEITMQKNGWATRIGNGYVTQKHLMGGILNFLG